MTERNEDLDELICYCFKFSKRNLSDAIKEDRENSFIDEIKKMMKDPGCFCEKANPSGKCCLNDIKNFIDEHKDRK